MYNITFKPKVTMQATARYKSKIFRKGTTYTVRRKLTPSKVRSLRGSGFKQHGIKSIKKIKKK